MEPIAASVAARGHEVHVVAPWHPLVTRGREEDGVHFHFYRYAPVPALNVFGYAAALRADVQPARRGVRGGAAGTRRRLVRRRWRVARRYRATVMHGHWVDSRRVHGAGGRATAGRRWSACTDRTSTSPRRSAAARRAARLVFDRAGAITACSADLARRAIGLGADPAKLEVVPYGVDTERFRPQPERARGAARADRRRRRRAARVLRRTAGAQEGLRVPDRRLGAASDRPRRRSWRSPATATCATSCASGRARPAWPSGCGSSATCPRTTSAPVSPPRTSSSCRRCKDDSGNVDGLPNVVLEALATGAPVIATAAGGIGTVVEHERDRARGPGAERRRNRRRGRSGWRPTRRCERASAVPPGAWSRPVSAGAAPRSGSRPPTAARLPTPLPGDRLSVSPMPSPVARKPGLSVFFPAYNDSGTIASLVIAALRAARKLTPDFEVIVVNDGSADATAEIVDELARTYPEVKAVHHAAEPRLRRRPAQRLRGGHARSGLLHRRRRAVRSVRDGRPVACVRRRRRPGQRLQDQPVGSAAPHRDRPHLPPHGEDAVRAAGPRRRLRLPADAPVDLRPGDAREEQRRHLPRDDEEDPGRRLPHRRGAGASLPSRARPVAVLQLPAADPDGGRRHEALVRARRPARAPARCAAGRGPGAGTAEIAGDGVLPRLLSRPPRHDHRRRGLHRQQPGAAARRGRRRHPDRRCPQSRVRRQPLQPERHRGRGPRQHRGRARRDVDEHAGPGPRGDLQPRRPGQSHRQHAGSVHRPRHQLPRPALDAGGLPPLQSRRSGSCTPARGRSTAGRIACRWTRITSSGRPTSTASTRRRASTTTCSTTTCSASTPRRCG